MRRILGVLICVWCIHFSISVKVIKNGLAPPEIVHTPLSTKPRCTVNAPPLDLLFILDSSGSLKNKFQDEIDIIRRITRHVTIGPAATRVMLVQFSGVQHLEFDFNAFNNREDLMSALSVLRHVSGITRTGAAFEFAQTVMKPEFGMRGPNVKKIAFLLSDGRTHDFPKDAIESEAMRRTVPNLDIWAYGTGDFVAMNELTNITKDASKIITNKNLDQLEPLFDFWHGVEVCEKQPVCVRGSDKPLDLALVIDSSDSIDAVFHDQITFVVERIVQNINVHPDAVRLALITYSGKVFVHFGFNDLVYGQNNTAVIRHLNELTSIKGVTSTDQALKRVYDLFTDPAQNSGNVLFRNATKLVIVITDGRSSRSPRLVATSLRHEGINIMAVSMHKPTMIDTRELEAIAGVPENIFIPQNLQNFESEFLKYVGFGCPGLELGHDAKPKVRGSTDINCGPNSITLTLRTQKPMNGLMYAQSFHNDPSCVLVANGKDRELSLSFPRRNMRRDKNCCSDGYNFNLTIILQFHPLIVTRADQGLDISCFSPQPIARDDLAHGVVKQLSEVECDYKLHRFSPDDCLALDAKIGESIYHNWSCDELPPNVQYLVHDCHVKSEKSTVQIIDSDGCEVDAHFIETPNYSKFATNQTTAPYVFQEMSAFSFPGESNVIFHCLISLCDVSSGNCAAQIPPKCESKQQFLTEKLQKPRDNNELKLRQKRSSGSHINKARIFKNNPR
ncbi:hypothetical protein M3Y97_00846100 [Aphelenchoides bicaudatus]|nr:hypothetical protein M3Y97_00846100 [Aphelenchoides bicaudatus]